MNKTIEDTLIKNIKIIREPKNIDFSTKSEPWTETELADFRLLMQEIKSKNKKRQLKSSMLKQKIVKSK